MRFLAQGGNLDTWVTKTGFAYGWKSRTKGLDLPLVGKGSDILQSANLFVDFIGSNPNAKTEGIHRLPGLYAFVDGNRVTRSTSFSSTVTHDLYPGIDLVNYFEPSTGEPRYDLIVRPGANPNQIRMRYRGAKDLSVDAEGQLTYSVGDLAKVEEQQKVAFQSGDHGADYHFMPRQVLEKDGTVGFDVSGYKKDRTLVIDPLIYSTYLGSGEGTDLMTEVAVDGSGNSLVGGRTVTSQFTGGVTQQQLGFVAKFAPDQSLIFQTIFTHSNGQMGSMAIDNSGRNYLTLLTDAAIDGDNAVSNQSGHQTVLFITVNDNMSGLLQDVLNPDTSQNSRDARITLDKSTNLSTIAVLVGFNAYIYQITSSNSVSAPTSGYADADFVYSLAGIAVDASGNIFLGLNSREKSLPGYSGANTNSPGLGLDDSNPAAAIVKTQMGNATPTQETFIGGVGAQQAFGFGLDPSGNPVIIGTILASSAPSTQGGVPVTTSFPTTAKAYEQGPVGANDCGFVCQLNNNLTLVQAATVFQTSSYTSVFTATVASDGSPVLVGIVGATLPLTWDYFDGHQEFSYLAKLSPDLSTLSYGTYFGDEGGAQFQAVAIDTSGKYYIAGDDITANYRTTANALRGYAGGDDGIFSILDPTVTTGLNSIHSDRGAAPALAGGSGRTLNVTVNLVEPTGTPITLVADQAGIVNINGVADQGTTVVSGYNHIASFFVTANDVATDTVVNLSVSMDGRTLSIPVRIHPFLKQVILRAATVASGTSTTAYGYPYEVPVTDHVVTLTSIPSAFSSTSVSIRGLASGESITGPTTKALSIGQFAVDTAVTVTAGDQDGVSSVSSALTVQGIDLASLVCSPETVVSGTPTTLTATLKAPYPTDVDLNITSSDPAHAGNSTIHIVAGQLTGSVSIPTSGVTGTKNVSVRFSDAAVASKVSAGLTITPSH